MFRNWVNNFVIEGRDVPLKTEIDNLWHVLDKQQKKIEQLEKRVADVQ